MKTEERETPEMQEWRRKWRVAEQRWREDRREMNFDGAFAGDEAQGLADWSGED